MLGGDLAHGVVVVDQQDRRRRQRVRAGAMAAVGLLRRGATIRARGR